MKRAPVSPSQKAAHQVADGKAHVAEHRLVEIFQRLLFVGWLAASISGNT